MRGAFDGSGLLKIYRDNDISAAPLDQASLTHLVEDPPAGNEWLHEIKYNGYRMHARLDGGKAKLLTRTGLDWSHRYHRTVEALRSLRVTSAYIDGELCALNADAVPVFSRLQAAMDEGNERAGLFRLRPPARER